MVTKEAHEYLEVNLHELHVITGTKTQGRFGNGQGQEYAEEFMLDYWRPGFGKWLRWRGRNRKEASPEDRFPRGLRTLLLGVLLIYSPFIPPPSHELV